MNSGDNGVRYSYTERHVVDEVALLSCPIRLRALKLSCPRTVAVQHLNAAVRNRSFGRSGEMCRQRRLGLWLR